MPRIAYLSKDEKEFYTRLDKMMDIAARSLKTKRTVISQLLDAGLYPYTKRYLGNFNNHFSTIGLVGMNEACLNANWIKEDLTHEKALQFTKDVLNHMRERLKDYQEMYGDLYNLEATPAESTSYRFAKHDVERYPDIITANASGTPYYTNSSHLPVGYTDDIFSALDLQDDLQTLYTSGTVFHAFLGEKLPGWKAAANLVRKISENYKLPYYTLSPTYSICSEHGYIAGEEFTCPKCGKKTEVYSRITGYYRPVQNWNDGKRQEFLDRKTYVVGSSLPLIKSKSEAASECNAEPIQNQTENQIETEKDSNNTETRVMLLKTNTCPNCKIAERFLDDAGIEYEKLLANENVDLVNQLNIRQAPTLVVQYGDNMFTKYVGVSGIKSYINAQPVVVA